MRLRRRRRANRSRDCADRTPDFERRLFANIGRVRRIVEIAQGPAGPWTEIAIDPRPVAAQSFEFPLHRTGKILRNFLLASLFGPILFDITSNKAAQRWL